MDKAPIQNPIQETGSDNRDTLTIPWILWLATLVSTISKNELQALPTYVDNTAARAGGLVAGTPYKTATGQVMVVY